MPSPIEPDEEQVVDQRLVEHFAICRDAPAADEVEPDAAVIEMIAKMASRSGSDWQRFGPVVPRARQVVVNPSVTVVVVPGKHGVLVFVPAAGAAFGAPSEAILLDSRIGSIGPLLLGLAPDGVEEQPVRLNDGSTIKAPVVSNVYAVKDPSWTSPEFA
jgi:hypothetical protein